jgi:L-asparaginase
MMAVKPDIARAPEGLDRSGSGISQLRRGYSVDSTSTAVHNLFTSVRAPGPGRVSVNKNTRGSGAASWFFGTVLALLFLFQGTTGAGVREGTAPLPRVVILATGGTIAGTAPSPSQTTEYKPGVLDVTSLVRSVPGLDGLAAVSGEQVARIGSHDMTDQVMLTLVGRINQLLGSGDADGVVVTHGTDTMEETAYFLNLTVKNRKPVVLTGSMRPATAMSADGPLNLYNAVAIAADGRSAENGVLVALNERIDGARDVTKTNTTNVDTFRSPGFGPLGSVIDGKASFHRATTRRHTSASEFTVDGTRELPRVDIIYGHAQGTGDLVEAAVRAGAKGIVHAGPGDGSIFHLTKKALVEARSKGVVVVRSSRVGSGAVTPTAKDDEDGFVSAGTLNPQKARILLMLALTVTKDVKEIQRMFSEY